MSQIPVKIKYILNTPILTAYGNYKFWKHTSEVFDLTSAVSAVGHKGTALLLSRVLKTLVKVNRVSVEMKVGEYALIFRVLTRLPEGKILSEEELSKISYEIGILYREG